MDIKNLSDDQEAWARRQLDRQGELLASVMDEGDGLYRDDLLSKVNALGHDWESRHLTAAIKNLKQREIAEQKGQRFRLRGQGGGNEAA